MTDISDLPAKLRERIKLTDCPSPEIEGECWEWTGYINPKGYGHVYYEGTTQRVHCLIYKLLVGAIEAGLQLDHLCRNRVCGNPSHLEPVTNAVNAARSGPATKTHCIRNHELSGHNLIIKSEKAAGRRQCRECKALSRKGLIAKVAS